MKAVRCLVAMALLVGACRFGGPSANPEAYVDVSDAAADAPDETQAVEPDDGDTASDVGSIDVDSGDGMSTDHDAPEDGPNSDSDSGEAAACMPPATIPVCNPLTNAGCALGQCDVDTSMTMPTGTCVLAALVPGDEGATCTQTAGSTPCQRQLTCFGGSCRKVCFCDPDCPASECCAAGDGTTGFKLCGACP